MNRKETEKILHLLRELYPRAKSLTGEDVVYAWQLVLEPYCYTDVRNAAVAWGRAHNYPPGVSELCAAQPQQQPAQRPAAAWMKEFL